MIGDRSLYCKDGAMQRTPLDRASEEMKMAKPIVYHHPPALAKEAKVQTAIVHLADVLIRAKDFGSGGDRWVPEIDKEAWNLLGFSLNELEDVVFKIGEEIFNIDGTD